MIYGTHNSATGGKLLWWLKPLAWIINPTSKCQDKTIKEQLEDGVRLFNLQVAYHNGVWRFSHGMALYQENVFETIALMKSFATERKPIYFQLYLDKSWWCKQDVDEFEWLIESLKNEFCSEQLVMLDTLVEGTKYHPYHSGKRLNSSEHYWTRSWSRCAAKNWLDKLPLPKYHAKKYNKGYKANCQEEWHRNAFLMLDYYNYE